MPSMTRHIDHVGEIVGIVDIPMNIGGKTSGQPCHQNAFVEQRQLWY
jgi:hypothetical protein